MLWISSAPQTAAGGARSAATLNSWPPPIRPIRSPSASPRKSATGKSPPTIESVALSTIAISIGVRIAQASAIFALASALADTIAVIKSRPPSEIA